MIIEYNTEKRYRLIEAISLKFVVYRWLVIKFPDLRRMERGRGLWRRDVQTQPVLFTFTRVACHPQNQPIKSRVIGHTARGQRSQKTGHAPI